jgi:hypothetical protein
LEEKVNKLRDKHKRFIYVTFGVTASLYFLLLLRIPFSRAALDLLGWFGISWSVVAGLVVFLYEKWAWRMFNAKFDFGGRWRFTEKQYRVGPDTRGRVFVCHGKGSMKILQDLRSICITEGQTYEVKAREADMKSVMNADLSICKKTADWWSIACEMDDDASKIYGALDHKSTLSRKGKPIEYGVEVFRVTERTRWGRPINMSSTVYHCVGAGDALQIDVNYARNRY